MMLHRWAMAWVMLGLALALLPAAFPVRPPVVSADAPAAVFSAERAMGELKTLLAEQTPHPLGSAAQTRVQERLRARLAALGLTPVVQDALGCNARELVCGRVQNVLAEIPGQTPHSILLMAHYDSVPAAPGAGDDGAGVATLLEIARALLNGAAPDGMRNGVQFLFADGEEAGLLGAAAFFAEHPWANGVQVVINVEGSGSGGPSVLLRPGPDSGAVLRAFMKVAPFPLADSVAQEVFKRMPNDTDFSIAMDAGKPGVDIAFAGERNHYHSPLDTIENLDPETVQHHGDNVLPLLKALLNADLSVRQIDEVYVSFSASLWLAYTPRTGWALALLTLLLTAVAGWRLRAQAGVAGVFPAVGFAMLLLLLTLAAELAVLALMDVLAGARVAYPAEPWPWRVVIWALPLTVLWGYVSALGRRAPFWAVAMALAWIWSALALVVTITAPMASHLLLPVALLLALLMCILAWLGPALRDRLTPVLGIVPVVAGYLLFPLACAGETTQGFVLAPVTFAPLALLLTLLLPMVALPNTSGAPLRWLGAAAAGVVITGVGASAWVPLYSEYRPQHLSFAYVVDADAPGHAALFAMSPNPLPSRVQQQGFAEREQGLPWYDGTQQVRPVPLVMSPPAATFEVEAHSGGERRFWLRSDQPLRAIEVQLPVSARPTRITMAGRDMELPLDRDDDRYLELRLMNPSAEGVPVAITFADAAPVTGYLVETTLGLPPALNAVTADRGPLAMPVGTGDRTVVYRKVVF